jgi:Na+/melibiose symporter-like transporter
MRFAVIGAGVIGALHAETIAHVAGAELTVVPAAFILISIAIMAFYPLTEIRFREIVREMAERRPSAAATTTAAPAP